MQQVCYGETMLSVYEIRRENLRSLLKQWGGPTSLAKKLGHSNGSYIAQLVGPHPSREISERVAREIEGKLGLPIGWCDTEQTAPTRLDDQVLSECVRVVAAAIRDADLKVDPDRYGILVGLVYDYLRLTGRMDEAHLNKLVRLMK